MQIRIQKTQMTVAWLVVATAIAITGCRRSTNDARIETRSPKAAASQLEEAFAQADSDMAEQARAAANAMESGQYQQAVASLQSIRSQQDLTLEQGMAVHGSLVSMEAQLIQAIQAGDPNARQAYELLKALKRK